jgi:lysophospholipase L1-like esterase
MLAQIKQIKWGGIPVLSTVPPRNSDHEAANRVRAELNDRIRSSGLPYVDRFILLCDPLDERRLHAPFASGDGIHIHAAGSRAVAEAAARVIGSAPALGK